MSDMNSPPFVDGVYRRVDHNNDDFHEWIEAFGTYLEERFGPHMVGIDSAGRENPRKRVKARRWVCNNPECNAQAFVLDEAIGALIDRVRPIR